MKKSLRSLAAIQAALIAVFSLNSVHISYAETVDDTPEPKSFSLVSTPSDSGLEQVKFIDEDGNELEFNLIPDIQMYSSLPSYYNLYDNDLVTSVKNQGQEGLCWAYAGMSAVESNLIMKNIASSSLNLSEKYMAWFAHGAGPSDTSDPLFGDISSASGTAAYDTGGNVYDIISLLSRGSGPVAQETVPQSTTTALSEDLRYTSLYSFEDSMIMDNTDYTSIKNAVYFNGAVYVSYYSSSSSTHYNSSTYSHYCDKNLGQNHAVTIVGWNDNYSASNFSTTPPADGAWIVKNSWGTGWGDNGLFYLSYYDKTISTVTSITMESENNYDNIYQYSGNFAGGIQYSSVGASIGNIFTANDDEYLTQAGFWTYSAETPYTISIYTDIPENGTPTSGTCVHTQNGNLTYAGYHKIELDESVKLEKGMQYSIVIDLMQSDAAIIMDSYDAVKNVSYYTSFNLSTQNRGAWNNCSTDYSCNIPIKAYTVDAEMTIEECIKLVNSLDLDSTAILTEEQLKAIERVLEYDYN